MPNSSIDPDAAYVRAIPYTKMADAKEPRRKYFMAASSAFTSVRVIPAST